ncbi:probable crossover junction endonuclease EME2 [Scyliorhinus canicula]|uniref:probable crossover junction endonuclease EME2 n=1 Tax=Scyliorhinus canicula TaxID=7830 RepID=UPI0018F6E238|nr:probable crossover junction endonuclease EME2 [Scyliorhinus canicula]
MYPAFGSSCWGPLSEWERYRGGGPGEGTSAAAGGWGPGGWGAAPGWAEPGTPTPGWAEPGTPTPGRAEPVTPTPGRAEPGTPTPGQQRSPAEIRAASWGSEILRRERKAAKESEMLERADRRAADVALKYIRPEECVKYMRVCMDPAILEDTAGYILLEVLNSLGSEYSIEPQSVPSTITWRREFPEAMLTDLSDETRNMYKSKEENQVLVLLSPNYFLRMVWSHKQKMKGIFTENICETFDSFIMRVLDKQLRRAATLAVIGLDTYTREKGLYSPVKRPKNSEINRVEDSESWVSRELGLTCADLDEVQVALQLQTHTTVWFLDDWQQFADHVATLTKAIARCPFKKQTEKMTFSFCPDGTWSTGVKVDKDGKGLLKLWKKQLQQLNRITQPVAMAIAQAYPTPKLLLRAYRQCTSEWEKQNLVSEVKVYAAGKRVDRRVGPDISRRLYIFMTSENSDIVLDKSG